MNLLIGIVVILILTVCFVYYNLNKQFKSDINNLNKRIDSLQPKSLESETSKNKQNTTEQNNDYDNLKEQYDSYVDSNNFNNTYEDLSETIKNEIDNIETNDPLEHVEDYSEQVALDNDPLEHVEDYSEQVALDNDPLEHVEDYSEQVALDNDPLEHVEDYSEQVALDNDPLEHVEDYSEQVALDNDPLEHVEDYSKQVALDNDPLEHVEDYSEQVALDNDPPEHVEDYSEQLNDGEELVYEELLDVDGQIHTDDFGDLSINNLPTIKDLTHIDGIDYDEPSAENVLSDLKKDDMYNTSLIDIEKMTVKELQEIAKKHNVSIKSKERKPDLIKKVKHIYNL